jgi:hypothetical protein
MNELLDELGAVETAGKSGSSLRGVVRGVFAGVDESGLALVDFAANPGEEPLPALSIVALTRADIGNTVVLSFEDGDIALPVIMGLVQPVAVVEAKMERPADALVDGDRLVLTARREIVLRCGDASLTLTADGKVLVRGHSILSRATDVHRIKGGSVHIN